MPPRRCLPIRAKSVEASTRVTEQMAISIDSKLLKGITMNKITDRWWSVYYQFFLRVAQEVHAVSPEKCSLDMEALKSEGGEEILGYRFILSMRDTKGDTLNGYGIRFVNDRATVTAYAASGEKDIKLAVEFLKRAKEGRLFAHEEWRSIDGPRTWDSIVRYCTGQMVGSSLDFTGSVYSMAMAFANTPDGVCAEQDICAMETYLSAPVGYAVGQNFGFPMPRYAYTVPADLCTVEFMYDIMIPSVQIDFAMREFDASKLVPLIINGKKKPAEAAAAAAAMDEEPSPRKRARARLLESIGATPFEHQEEAKEAFRGLSKIVGSANEKESLFGVTPFDEMRAHADKVGCQITAYHSAELRKTAMGRCQITHKEFCSEECADELCEKQHGAENADVAQECFFIHVTGAQCPLRHKCLLGHARYFAKPVVTGRSQMMPYTECDTKVAVKTSRMRTFVQNALSIMFDPLMEGSPKMSPMGRIIVDYGREQNLSSFRPTVWFIETRPADLSFNGFFIEKSLVIYELVFKVNTLHSLCAAAEEYSLDAYRYGLNLHLNLLLLSNVGATGKSAVFELMSLLRIPGTVESLLYATTAAFAIDGDATGNRNLSDYIMYFDEVPPGVLGVGTTTPTDMESRVKTIQTTQTSKYRSLKFNDDGNRESTGAATLWNGIFLGCTNANADDKHEGISHAVLSRWSRVSISEEAGKRKVEYMMMEQARDRASAKPLIARIKNVFHQTQYYHLQVEKRIQAGVLFDVSTHGASYFLTAFIRELSKEGLCECNARTWIRVETLARLKCIKASEVKLMQDYAHHGEQLRDEHINSKTILSIAPMLYVTVEQVICSISDLAEEIYPPLPYAIRMCVKQLYDEQMAHACRPAYTEDVKREYFRGLFSDEGATSVDPQTRNYAYYSVLRHTLMRQIMSRIKKFMGGFQPSLTSCEAALESLAFANQKATLYDTIWDVANARPMVTTVGTERKRYPVMRKLGGQRPNLMKYEFHVKWILGTNTGQGSDVKRHSNIRMGAIIKKLMSSKYQLPRKVAFGESSKGPDTVAFLDTLSAAKTEDRNLFTVGHWSHYSKKNDSILPEYRTEVNSATRSEPMSLMADIDVYAFEEHARKIGYVPYIIDNNTDKKISEILAREDPNEQYFFGTRVSHISPDKLKHITDEQIERIGECISQEDEHDSQFEEDRYLCLIDEGGEDKTGHWNFVRQNFRAQDFGFSKWADTESELIGQYKMRCMWNPIIQLDFYMTPTEREASARKRDAKNLVPVNPQAPLLIMPVAVPHIVMPPDSPEHVPEVQQVPRAPVELVPEPSLMDEDLVQAPPASPFNEVGEVFDGMMY